MGGSGPTHAKRRLSRGDAGQIGEQSPKSESGPFPDTRDHKRGDAICRRGQKQERSKAVPGKKGSSTRAYGKEGRKEAIVV